MRVAILIPAPDSNSGPLDLGDTRFAETAAALRSVGLSVEAAPYTDETVSEVQNQLLGVDAVLVWVNPIEDERDRSVLNRMLSDVARSGVFVSAHPDVIGKLGTKKVLYKTRDMAWGCDTRFYGSLEEMRYALPARLADIGACVLKQVRGNGGNGVWKLTIAEGDNVKVRHAKRGSLETEMTMPQLFDICAPYFESGGGMIDQPYQARLTDGMIRCYMVHDKVVGFGEQLINALYPAAPDADPASAPMPGQRLYYPPTRSDFQPIKTHLEESWLPELCCRFDLGPLDLPIIWDADFLYGPRDSSGQDTYVLCEINVSSVYPFPESALQPIANATKQILASK